MNEFTERHFITLDNFLRRIFWQGEVSEFMAREDEARHVVSSPISRYFFRCRSVFVCALREQAPEEAI